MISGPKPASPAPWVAPLALTIVGLLALAGAGWWGWQRIQHKGAPIWPLILLLVSLIVTGFAVTWFLKRLRADPPEFTFLPASVRPGEELRVSYRQRFRRPATVTRAALELVFVEQATTGSGQRRQTFVERAVIATTAVTDLSYGSGDELVLALTARVPREAMHSFAAAQNELLWCVEASVDIEGWPDEAASGIVVVRAEPPA